MTANPAPLGWFSIFRLALVQTALGAIVVLTTSTMNRVMVVELMLPAMLPGALVTLHHALQILRPRWGHGSDVGGHRTPWIIGGMAVLAIGGTGAAAAIAVMAHNTQLGIMLAVLAFALVGIGVGATGTSLLALLATSVAPERRAPAATMVWMMMIAGFIVTTILAGSFLDPFTPMRLIAVTASVSAIAFVVATAAIWGVEKRAPQLERDAQKASKPDFKISLRQVWSESQARRFTIFIFISMLAYSMQDLILEPYAGVVFGLTRANRQSLRARRTAACSSVCCLWPSLQIPASDSGRSEAGQLPGVSARPQLSSRSYPPRAAPTCCRLRSRCSPSALPTAPMRSRPSAR